MGRFDVKILGRGGHAAQPHLCADALEVGTQVVAALQRIVSRQTNPIEPSVVTVGTFHAGTAFNIIPAEAVMSGTTRTFNEEVWASWEARIEKVVKGVCAPWAQAMSSSSAAATRPPSTMLLSPKSCGAARRRWLVKNGWSSPNSRWAARTCRFFYSAVRGVLLHRCGARRRSLSAQPEIRFQGRPHAAGSRDPLPRGAGSARLKPGNHLVLPCDRQEGAPGVPGAGRARDLP